MIVPGSNCVRRPPTRAPVCVMSIVCARWLTASSVTFTGNTIFLRVEMRLFSIGRPLSCVTRARKSYYSHPTDQTNCRYRNSWRPRSPGDCFSRRASERVADFVLQRTSPRDTWRTLRPRSHPETRGGDIHHHEVAGEGRI